MKNTVGIYFVWHYLKIDYVHSEFFEAIKSIVMRNNNYYQNKYVVFFYCCKHFYKKQ